jgi:hypothetical protein
MNISNKNYLNVLESENELKSILPEKILSLLIEQKETTITFLTNELCTEFAVCNRSQKNLLRKLIFHFVRDLDFRFPQLFEFNRKTRSIKLKKDTITRVFTLGFFYKGENNKPNLFLVEKSPTDNFIFDLNLLSYKMRVYYSNDDLLIERY